MPTASDLFALANGGKNEGINRCHWCGSQCTNRWRHDDPGPIQFSKFRLPAKFPQELFICWGCWLYRRASYTVRFLKDTFKDRQTGHTTSWYITSKGAWGVIRQDCSVLLDLLLTPDIPFALLLTDGSVPNYLQCAVVNDQKEVTAETPLTFTLNNVPYTYTTYEIEDAIKTGIISGKEAGVRELVQFLSPCLPPPEPQELKIRGRGEKEEKGNPLELLKKTVSKK